MEKVSDEFTVRTLTKNPHGPSLFLKQKSFKSNKKISEMYSMFKTRVHKLKNQPTAVAVSGGPDSLALSAMSKALEYDKWKKFKFILVDHGIRKNSNKEALQVKKLLSKFNISLIILINKKPIVKNIQSKAREIRYNLAWCE